MLVNSLENVLNQSSSIVKSLMEATSELNDVNLGTKNQLAQILKKHKADEE